MGRGKAFTRAVSPRLAECALTHLARRPIDAARAAAQHASYEAALAGAGLTVERLEPLPDHPDGVFVEDTALILDGHAIVTRPGAPSRAGETESTAAGLARDFDVRRLEAGHLDGGDVLEIGRTLYVGCSGRTDADGLAALAAAARPLGYDVVGVTTDGCLHLKSAATFAGHDAAGNPVLIHDPGAISADLFAEVDPVAVAPGERAAANVVRIGGLVLMPADCPRTAEMLAARGFDIVALDVNELQKAEAGLTCMSLIARGAG